MTKKITDKIAHILLFAILFVAWIGYAIKEDLKKKK